MAERKAKDWRIDTAVGESADMIIVRAKTEREAVAHAVGKYIRVRPATHDDAIVLGAKGGKIEEAAE